MIQSITSSFSDTLAKVLLDENKDNLFGMSEITLILPTKRAIRTMKDAFLKRAGGKTLLLPKMVTLYDLESFSIGMKPQIDELERQFILTKLCLKKQALSFEKGFELASSLAQFIDEMNYYDVSFDQLKELVPDEYAEHWQQTLKFLEIIGTFWPQILNEKGKIDPSTFRLLTLKNIADAWTQHPPKHPVIAAGFAGGLPFVNIFLKEVLTLPKGRLIFPFIDTLLSDEEWEKLDETHPQYYMKNMLQFLKVERNKIDIIHSCDPERMRLISESMKPAQQTDTWINTKPFSKNVLNDIHYYIADTPDEEALTIALKLREVLEYPNKTAALVTTNRNLGRRVIAHMSKWGITLDDSGGKPLSQTSLGRFLIHLADAAVSGKDTDMLAVLKHPLAVDGQKLSDFRRSVQHMEKKARESGKPLSFSLASDLGSFFSFFKNPVPVPFEEIVTAHLKTAESLATSADRTGTERLWGKEEGNVAAALLEKIREKAYELDLIDPIQYPAFLKRILDTQNVRPPYGMHPRLDIFGAIESRLQNTDMVIIGGLNEGVFPENPSTDAWLSRPMRKALNLPQPEEKIGVAANDFVSAFMSKEVILTRSLKEDGTPTIPSRWLLRIETVLNASGIAFKGQKDPLLSFFHVNKKIKSLPRPAPKPPVNARPKKISITEVEKWMRDPYAIYAKHVLGLRKLDELDPIPGKKEYGIAVHDALNAYLKLDVAEQTLETLLELGNKEFEKQGLGDEQLVFLKPAFERMAAWFVMQKTPSKTYLESKAALDIKLPSGDTFTLYGRADRMDILDNGNAEIIDYKTGPLPLKKDTLNGFAPQLPLEAFLLEKGAFTDIPTHTVDAMTYWQINGKGDGGTTQSVSSKDKTTADIIAETVDGFLGLVQTFAREETPYTACPIPSKRPLYNDYAHLERLNEWMGMETEDDDE